MDNLKRSRPVPDKKIYNFIKNSIDGESLYEYDDLHSDFCKGYSNWIQSTKLNTLKGLDLFESLQYSYGTTESFDSFTLIHNKKRMRCFKGDYIYHRLSWDKKFNWCYLEDDRIQTEDAVIMSLPFSDSGDIHPRTNEILDDCDKWEVPVFIDCAYMIIARDIKFDFNRECIQGVSFSMSKGFYGAERLRIGLRYSKKYVDDNLEVKNSMGMRNPLGMSVGLKIMDSYKVDYSSNTYIYKQKEFCNQLDIIPSKCVVFGLADKSHPEFGSFDRGTDFRRVCLSSLMGDMEDLRFKNNV